MKKFIVILLLLITGLQQSWATTWKEPWAEDVIKGAGSFVLVRVVPGEDNTVVRVHLIRTLAGEPCPTEIVLRGFYLLVLCSTSTGHGAELDFDGVDSCYLLIRKMDNGGYSIATPTSGFAPLDKGQVTATYRHSYHQASVPLDVYEKTTTAIFNYYHSISQDMREITAFVDEQLKLPPAGFDEESLNTFFLQHVALECVYHLQLPVKINKVLPFLHDTTNFHNQVSAARAMSVFNNEQGAIELLGVLLNANRRNFVKVLCVQSLPEQKYWPKNISLDDLINQASEKEDGFSANIMDPRICTNLPTVKKALMNWRDKKKSD